MTRLTSVANVKAFLAITGGNQDALINRLIAQESALIVTYTGRSFVSSNLPVARLNGTGTDTIVLHEQPVTSVYALNAGGANVPLSTDGCKFGYVFDDTSLSIIGGKFPQGKQNITVGYTAGYRTTENGVIPVPAANVATSTIQPTSNFASVDRGVTFANGVVMIAVNAGANVALGQYSFGDGIYTFNGTQNGASVVMSFDYVPADVEQACIEMVGLDLKQRDNLGVTSKTLAGESITYEKKGLSQSAKEMLAGYRRLVPA